MITATYPKLVVKTYPVGWVGKKIRVKEEAKLIADGYRILQEENIKEWDAGTACCLLLLFFPLVVFARIPKTRVTYEWA